MFWQSLLQFVLVVLICLTPLVAGGQDAKPQANANPPVRLKEITDVDDRGRVQSVRSEMKFDEAGKRVANKVFDGGGRLLATEEFRYDGKGRLVSRKYSAANGGLKWRWNNFQHNSKGEPTRNDIVTGKGKMLGRYEWRYDAKGRLTRRDRLNADGSLRFYYANLKHDVEGNFVEWTKFSGKQEKIGLKKWTFAP